MKKKCFCNDKSRPNEQKRDFSSKMAAYNVG